MDKDNILLHIKQDRLIIEPGPVAYPPVINTESLILHDEGELSKGFYFYAITAVGVNGESSVFNILQVNAKYKNNSVSLIWDVIPHLYEYRIYRGNNRYNFDGYFTIYTENGYFHDDGRGVLNMEKNIPPEFTQIPDSSRIIHKDSIDFFEEKPFFIFDLVLKSGEVITLDIKKIINYPVWRKVYNDLNYWKNGNR